MTIRTSLLGLGMALALLCACKAEAESTLTVIKSSDNYELRGDFVPESPGSLKGKFALSMVATGKWKMNEKSPVLIDIEEQPDLGLMATRLKKDKSIKTDTKSYLFEIPIQATAKKDHPLKMKFDFVLCTAEVCQRKTFEFAHTLSIK